VPGVIAGLFRFHGPHGILARTLSTGTTTLLMAVLLVVLLVTAYWN
jgi:hypothetical protein